MSSVWAQPSLSLSKGSGAPGSGVSVAIGFSPNGTPATGVQWTMNYSSMDFSSVTVSASSIAAAAGEVLSCSTGSGRVTCLLINLGSSSVLVPSGGIATATFQISSTTTSTSSPITLSGLAASNGAGGSLGLTGTGSTISIGQPQGSQTPVVVSLVNAASYVDDGCSPGTVATLLGRGFVNTAAKSAATGPIPIEVNGLRVRMNGNYVPVYFASESQVNIQCPESAPNSVLTLVVESQTGSSPPLSTTLQYATPGIFTLDGSGKGQGAVLIANSSAVVMAHTNRLPSQPAKPGDSISIYATGLGPVTVNLPSGQPAPLDTLVHSVAPVDVVIGGVNAKVTFAGLAPGYTGLFQVNAKIPASAPVGDTVTVWIVTHAPNGSTVQSNVVTIAIAAAAH
jgi:uncharacterized protein (TIGR03437 family)